MLTFVSLVTGLSVGIFYPLCFLIHAKTPIQGGFHRFHLGMPLVVGGVTFVYLLLGDLTFLTKGLLLVWFSSLMLLSLFYWNKESPKASAIVIPPLFGFFAFFAAQFELLDSLTLKQGMVAGVLAGLVLCGSLHSMTLGHHYLNVRGLPIRHLRRANNALWVLLGVRLVWDSFFLFYGKMAYRGEEISLVQFSLKPDGFLLWIGIFFGTVLPFAALFFVREILKVRDTQSATGVLYVILCSVFMGDLATKYYWMKFGIAL